MKLAIKADVGQNIGMGHYTRCSAIAEETRQLGHDVKFIDTDNADEFIKEAKNYGADCALVDSYIFTENCYKKIRDTFFTVVIDDNARLPYAADMLINANLYARELDYSNCNVGTKLLGGKYAILRKEFREQPRAPFSQEVKRVLVTMGGADVNDYTPVALEGLAGFSGLEIITVIGSLFKCGEDIAAAAKKCEGVVSILNTPDNMAEIMSSCDIAISSAGSTVCELCAMGVPSVLIQQADNQSLSCDYFRRTGLMRVLGSYKEVKPTNIENAVRTYIDNPELRKVTRSKLRSLVDCNGARNIVEAIHSSRSIHQC